MGPKIQLGATCQRGSFAVLRRGTRRVARVSRTRRRQRGKGKRLTAARTTAVDWLSKKAQVRNIPPTAAHTTAVTKKEKQRQPLRGPAIQRAATSARARGRDARRITSSRLGPPVPGRKGIGRRVLSTDGDSYSGRGSLSALLE